jgi:hypothetical protein
MAEAYVAGQKIAPLPVTICSAPALTPVKENEPMTTSTAPGAQVQIVPITLAVAEVRITTGGAPVSIGRVGSSNGRWYWQHRDGEQSSPVAESRGAAATLLADYHRAFKPQPAAAPVRRLLFAQA